MKYVCESHVSGTEPWTFHVSEVVQGQGVRFVILGNLEACQKYYPAEACDRESSRPGGDTPFFPVFFFETKQLEKKREALTYPNFAKSVHSFMTYRLNPFSISENLGEKKSTSEHMRLNGAPNTNPMSTPCTAPAQRGNGEKSGRCSKTYK